MGVGGQIKDETMWYGVIQEDSLREVGIKGDRSLKGI